MTTTSGGAGPRVLVIDDEPQIGRAVQRSLEARGMAVAVVGTGEDGLDQAAATSPDLVIVDLGLPDIGGLAVIERLRSWSDVPVIVLSGVGDERTKVRALDLGADDFVSKPFGVEELRARVAALLRRSSAPAAASPVRRFGALVVDLADVRVLLDGTPLRLTKTEHALLEAFVTNPGKLLTHSWLLDRVWGRGVGPEGRQYLRVYTGQLRAKLRDDAASPRYIQTEPGIGYRWIAPSD